MAKFQYTVNEIYQAQVTVEAEDPAEAAEKLKTHLVGMEVQGIEYKVEEGCYFSFNPMRPLN